MRPALRLSLALVAVLLPLRPPAAQQLAGLRPTEEALRGLDAEVEAAMRRFRAPGVAIAIVRGDSVILAKGYGVRTAGRPEPVTARTMFAIASTTKAMTATLAAMLVDEGKLRWDAPVTSYLPEFQLHDAYVTRDATLRDLLTHRLGLPRGDVLWYGTSYTSAEVLRRVRYLRPAWSPRTRYGYQNIMYLAAGEATARAAGKRWDVLLRERLLEPLGMTSTTTSLDALQAMPDVATPHGIRDDRLVTIPWTRVDNAAPAGAVNSNAEDMAKWVRFQLDSARVDGKRLLRPQTFAETHMPQTVVRLEGLAKRINQVAHLQSYAMGWTVQDHRGRELVQHGGNLAGMSSKVALLPEEKLGVVVLVNLDGTLLRDALTYAILDRFVGVRDRDWPAEHARLRDSLQRKAQADERAERAKRVADTRPSLPLERYAGTYADSMLGELKVTHEDGRLVLRYGTLEPMDLEHWHHDVFQATSRDWDREKAFVSFTLDVEGRPAELTVRLGQAYTFGRAAGGGGER